MFESNSYVCPTSVPGECLLVDPGLDLAAVEAGLAESGLRPVAVLCTHGHFDHLGSAGAIQNRYQVPVYLHRDDARTANTSNFLMMAFKVPGRIALPRFDFVDGSFDARFGGDEVRWLHTPGHTPGSSVLLFRGNAFTGDTLYRDGVGLVSLPGEDAEALRRSIAGLFDVIPEDAVVQPGHGGSGRLGDIKRGNLPLQRFLGTAT